MNSLQAMLNRRGFEHPREIDRSDLILPLTGRTEDLDRYYRLFSKYSFRLVLRDIINHQASFTVSQLTRFCSEDAAEAHVEALAEMGIVQALGDGEHQLVRRPVRSFGLTLEWFVAELFKREFGAEVLWGIRFKNTPHGGDFDLLAALEGNLVYAEVKSSPPKHIELTEINAFLNRVNDLLPHLAIFFEDTELRMKDKIVPMFQEELKHKHGASAERNYPVERLTGEIFHINRSIFITNSRRDVKGNLQACFRSFFGTRLAGRPQDVI